jgi:acyl-coenzyme A synthetase/AMP-(fatty) acid ligase
VEMNRIAAIVVVDSLPRTPSDKVQKQLLRANWTCPTS